MDKVNHNGLKIQILLKKKSQQPDTVTKDFPIQFCVIEKRSKHERKELNPYL